MVLKFLNICSFALAIFLSNYFLATLKLLFWMAKLKKEGKIDWLFFLIKEIL